MEKLEKKIVKKMYEFETRRTVLEIALRVCVIAIFAVGIFIVGQVIVSSLIEQKTVDLLEIFREDWQIIQEYIGEVILTIYEELPQQTFYIFFLIFILFILASLTFITNFEKMKTKFKSLIHYWFQK